MNSKKHPLSRRNVLKGMGAGAAGIGATMLGQQAMVNRAAANSSVNDNPPVENVKVISNVNVEMRDGTKLSTDVYLPDLPGKSGKGKTFPTLVARTPYNKEFSDEQAKAFARHKYAAVVQDVRGKFASEGDFYPYRSEGFAENKDSYDTIEWAADQSWSNGKVGTYDISYSAGVQWALVQNEELPPHLETMAPGYAVASYYGQGAYSGGAALLSHNMDYLTGFAVERYNRENATEKDGLNFVERAQEAMPQLFWDLPVVPFNPMQRTEYPWLNDWFTHETYDDYWQAQDQTRYYDKVDIPVLTYGGWYDIFDQGDIWNYQGLREDAQPAGQDGATLVMGPYTHGANALRAQGEATGSAYYFPDNSTFDETALLLSWFDHVLKDNQTTPQDSRVRLYVPGFDEWIGGSSFPLSETDLKKFYLHSNGNANIGDITDEHYNYEGKLSTDPPSNESPDEYTYDPSDPVVTVGGYNTHWEGGVADRSIAYQNRDDILVYETEVLENDVAVIGPMTVTLYASTSAKDTDFVVTLSDVDPTARTGGIWVAEGARRGRIGDVSADPREQETYAEVNLLDSGKVYEWKIAVWPTARLFAEGHRIRIDVTSSNFPRYNRNLNTGEGLTGTEIIKADQTIYHDGDHPSNIKIPTVPVNSLEDMVIDGPVPESSTGGNGKAKQGGNGKAKHGDS